MQRIPFSCARPGMVLAKEIYRIDSSNGPPICGKGLTLSESLIERLRTLDIQSVTVEGHPVWMEGDKTLEEQLADLDKRFRRSISDPLTLKLKAIYREYLIRAMGE
jgi:hypothetical protein